MTKERATELGNALTNRFGGGIEFESVAKGKYRFALTSDYFNGMPHLRRQDEIWGLLDEVFAREITSHISTILAFAPVDLAPGEATAGDDIPMTESEAIRLANALKQHFGGEAEFEAVNSKGHYRFAISSDYFDSMPQLQRQDEVWAVAGQLLSREASMGVSVILTFAPAELSDGCES